MSSLRSPDTAMVRAASIRPLLVKEFWGVITGRALWTMLLILCPLVGYSFFQAVSLYGEASAAARDAPALATALDGVLVPTFGALPRGHAAVSLCRYPCARTRKGNGGAPPAGPVAVPGSDADRGQDGRGDGRLADFSYSGALGAGALEGIWRAPLCARDREPPAGPPPLWPSSRRDCP